MSCHGKKKLQQWEEKKEVMAREREKKSFGRRERENAP
jgi:hypothetical protein